MVSIFGQFNWEEKMSPISQTQFGLSSDRLQISIKETQSDRSVPFVYDEPSDCYFSLVGYLNNFEELKSAYNLRNVSQTELFSQLCSKNWLTGINRLDGLFLLMILDVRNHQFNIVQMQPGFSLPLYYADTGKGFVFSSSLKELLPIVGGNRQLNSEAVSDFLYHQYMIPNSGTLLQGVNKLVPGNYIEVDYRDCVYSLKCIPPIEEHSRYSRKEAKAKLLDSVRDSVSNLINQSTSNKTVLTLTSGWDTNLILYFLSAEATKPITAVTIKGGKSYDETQNAARIINDNYDNVDHLTSTVKADCIDELPELVWRYEGYLFEGGMFLRHELGKVLHTLSCNEVFLGVGADQVLFPETAFKDFLRRLKNKLNSVWSFRYSFQNVTRKKDYVILIDYNTKMHAMMLNYLGMWGFFPFINRKTSELAGTLGLFNNWRKRFYKQKVRELLGESIAKYISKSGAVVDTKAIFLHRKELLLKILTSSFTQRFLTLSQIETIRKDPVKYRLIIIQLVYLFLFNELFVSGRFDKQFSKPEVNLGLVDFMESGKFIPHDV